MNKFLLILPMALVSLTSCSIAQQLNDSVDASTCSIYENAAAVEYSTQVVRQNEALIKESNAVLDKNAELLEKLSKG